MHSENKQEGWYATKRTVAYVVWAEARQNASGSYSVRHESATLKVNAPCTGFGV